MLLDDFASKVIEELSSRGPLRFKDLLGAVKNPKTLSRKLAQLSSAGLVSGGGGGYRLTERGSRAAELIAGLRDLLGGPKAEIKGAERIPHKSYRELLRRYCRILLDNYGERLLGVAVFGSIARGDWDLDSDIDLLVVVEGWDDKPVWERVRELVRLRGELRRTEEYRSSLRLGYRAIIQHYPLGGGEALAFHRIYMDACVDGIVLYERDRFLTGLMEGVRDRLAQLGAKRVSTPGGRRYWVLSNVKAGEGYRL